MASKIPMPGQNYVASAPSRIQPPKPRRKLPVPPVPNGSVKHLTSQLEESLNPSSSSSKTSFSSDADGLKQDASSFSNIPSCPPRTKKENSAVNQNTATPVNIPKPKESSSIPRFSSPNRVTQVQKPEVRQKITRNSSDYSDSSSSSKLTYSTTKPEEIITKKPVPRYTSPSRLKKSGSLEKSQLSNLLAKSKEESRKSLLSGNSNINVKSRSSLVETIRSSIDKSTEDLNEKVSKQSYLRPSKSFDNKYADKKNKNEDFNSISKSRLLRFSSSDTLSYFKNHDMKTIQTETSDTEIAQQSHRSHLHKANQIEGKAILRQGTSGQKGICLAKNKAVSELSSDSSDTKDAHKFRGRPNSNKIVHVSSDSTDTDAHKFRGRPNSNKIVNVSNDSTDTNAHKFRGRPNSNKIVNASSDSTDTDSKKKYTKKLSNVDKSSSPLRYQFSKKSLSSRSSSSDSQVVKKNRDSSLPRPSTVKKSSLVEDSKHLKLGFKENQFQRGRTRIRKRHPSNENAESNAITSDQNDSGIHSSKDSETSGNTSQKKNVHHVPVVHIQDISNSLPKQSSQEHNTNLYNVVKLTDSLLSVYEIQEGAGNDENNKNCTDDLRIGATNSVCSNLSCEENAESYLQKNTGTVVSSVSVGQLSSVAGNTLNQNQTSSIGLIDKNTTNSKLDDSRNALLRSKNNHNNSKEYERHSWGSESSFDQENTLVSKTWHAGDIPRYDLPENYESESLVESGNSSGKDNDSLDTKNQDSFNTIPPFGAKNVSYLSTFLSTGRVKVDRSPSRQITVQTHNSLDSSNAKPPVNFTSRIRPNSPRTMSPLLAIKPQMIRRNSFKERATQERPVVKQKDPRSRSPVVANPEDRNSVSSDISEKLRKPSVTITRSSNKNQRSYDSSDDQSVSNIFGRKLNRDDASSVASDTDQDTPPKLPPKLNSPRNCSPVLAFPFGRNSPSSTHSTRTGRLDSGSESDAPVLPPRRSPRSSPNSLSRNTSSSLSPSRRPSSALPLPSSRENSPGPGSKSTSHKVVSQDNSPLSLLLSNNRKIQEANSMVFTPIRNTSPFRGSAASTPTEEQNMLPMTLKEAMEQECNSTNQENHNSGSIKEEEKVVPSPRSYLGGLRPPQTGSRGNSPVRASHEAQIVSNVTSHYHSARQSPSSLLKPSTKIPTFGSVSSEKTEDFGYKIPITKSTSRGNSPVRTEPQVIPPQRPRSSPPVISYTDRNDSSIPVQSSGVKVLVSKSSKKTFFTKQDLPTNKPPLGRSISKESKTSSDSMKDDGVLNLKRFVRQESVGDSDSSVNTDIKPKRKTGILKQFSDDSDGSDYSVGKGGRDSPSRKRVTFDKEIMEREAKKELKDAKLKASLADFVKKKHKQISQSSEYEESPIVSGTVKKVSTMTESDMAGVRKYFLSHTKRKRSSNSDSEKGSFSSVSPRLPQNSSIEFDSEIPIYSTVDKTKKSSTQPDNLYVDDSNGNQSEVVEGEYVSLSDLKVLEKSDKGLLNRSFEEIGSTEINTKTASEYLQYLEETDLDHIELNVDDFDNTSGTTRPPRPGENNGVDYTFLTVEEFMALEKSGNLLESGMYEGHQYGTPKPPKDPIQPVRRTNSKGALLLSPDPETRRKRNRSIGESMMNKDDYPDIPYDGSGSSTEKVLGVGTPNLGPLPSNWEMAFTDDGTPYFIDHAGAKTQWQDPRFSALRKKGKLPQLQQHKNKSEILNTYFYTNSHSNETTHWLDPRLAKNQKMSPLDCNNDELPYGWEKVEDPHYGTYFIDHVNRKTQYENPVIQAKRQALEAQDANKPSSLGARDHTAKDNDINGNSKSPPAYSISNRPPFTKNPDELRGDFLKTQLEKSPRGFGFTILGGNVRDEDFLQIKNIVPGGPASEDGVLKTGDVLVYVKNNSVLGFTHSDVVHLFQSIPIGEKVTIEVLRGYPLPFDPDDPNTEIVTTVAVTQPQDSRTHSSPPAYSADSKKSYMKVNRQQNDDPFSILPSSSRPELLSVNIVKGAMGFGFTIADSAYGQKVRQILDRDRCKTLLEGDILVEINHTKVKDMPHSNVVSVLKECPQGVESTIIVQRGGMLVPNRNKVSGNRSPRTISDDSGKGRTSHHPSNLPKSFSRDETQGGSLDEGMDQQDGSRLNESHDSLGNRADNSGVPDLVVNSTHRSKTPTFEIERGRSKSPANMLSSYDRQYPASNSSGQSRRDGGYSNHSSEGYSDRTEPSSMQGYNFPNSRGELSSRSFGPADRQNDQSTTARFRSRTPGPDFMRGKPTEGDQQLLSQQHRTRSKTPTFSHSSSISGTPDFIPASQYSQSQQNQMLSSLSQEVPSKGINSSVSMNRHGDQSVMRPVSNPDLTQGYNNVVGPSINPSQSYNSALSNKGYTSNDPRLAGHKISTSFEYVDPVPSNLTRIPQLDNRQWTGSGPDVFNRSRSPFDDDRFVEISVQLHRQESGFGFRIIGGTEEGSQVSVGHIVPGGSADQDGQLRPGDEIIQVDGVNVIGCSHHKVVQLMGQSAVSGAVSLTVRRKLGGQPGGDMMPPPSSSRNIGASRIEGGYPYDVVVSRRENEGFGFVIMSSVTKAGSVIGRVIERSPAERCGKLHVGDRILAVNGTSIMHMPHEDIVNLVKDSGYTVTLTVGPPTAPDPIYKALLNRASQMYDASSTASHNSQNAGSSGHGSGMNAAGYPVHSESEMSWRSSEYSPHHNHPPVPPPHLSGSSYNQQPPQPPLPAGQPPAVPAKPHHILEKHREMARQMAHPSSSQASPVSSIPEEDKYYQVELHRGSRGFGFSIRGGKEFNNMPLFVLKVAPGGAADLDGRLRVGDQIIEINGHNTMDMTHAEAIDLIQNGGSTVKALVKRTGKLPPHFVAGSGPPSSSSGGGGGSQIPVRSHQPTPTLTLPNGPIGPISQSSPNPNRRPPETSYFTNFQNY